MRKIYTLLVLAVLLLSVSCKKNYHKVKGDYFIVGWSGTFAGTAAYYIVTDNQLLQDTTHYKTIPEAVGDFRFDYPLPDAKFTMVRTLPIEIPAELLSHNNEYFGKVSMSDGVGMEVRTMMNGMQYRWYFNDDLSECSYAVRQFGSKVFMFANF